MKGGYGFGKRLSVLAVWTTACQKGLITVEKKTPPSKLQDVHGNGQGPHLFSALKKPGLQELHSV